MSNVVVIGGGTGNFTLLQAMKTRPWHITALVNMADDGGSTGILRDELGVLPPGDVRQCLVALAESPKLRDLFSYRFDEGSLGGHSFGNLFLTALEKMTGEFGEGVKIASEVLKVKGKVLPMTLDNVTLVMEQAGGQIHRGEYKIAHVRFTGDARPTLRLEPRAKLNPEAAEAIAAADMIVIAPGNLYGSLGPALIVDDVGQCIGKSRAVKVYVCNLVTKPGQTDGFKVHDFAAEIERFMGGALLDYVLYNNAKPDPELLRLYSADGEYWVEYDETELTKAHYEAVGGHFVSDTPWRPTNKRDLIPRTLIRHNAERVVQALLQLGR